MTETWGDVCAHCAKLLAGVPLHVVVITGLTSLVGLFVLVWCCCPLLSDHKARMTDNILLWLNTVLHFPLARRAHPPTTLPRREEIQNYRERWIGHGASIVTVLDGRPYWI